MGAITRELATLLRAGLPLDRALEVLISLAPTVPVAALLQGILDDVRGGTAPATWPTELAAAQIAASLLLLPVCTGRL